MIKRVENDEELRDFFEALPYGQTEKNTEALLIYERFLCYGTKYDFCKFFKTDDDCVINEMYNSFVLHGGTDFDVLTDFFAYSAFNEIICSYEAGRELSARRMLWRRNDVNLMIFKGTGVSCETQKDVPISDFVNISGSCFDLDTESYYLEFSHRVRHNVSQLRRLNNSVLTVQHDLCGSALIAQVATLPGSRGNGDATRLVLSACAEFSSSEVYLLCEDKMVNFYKRIRFEAVGKKSIIKNIF